MGEWRSSLKMVDVSHGVFGGVILLCGNGPKCGEHCAVVGAAVVEENADYFL